ncbi:MAG: lipoyl synthase [Deltaproteobacteria bacterium]|nr:lipoyl synthase [Deltaproteobacteria bacterium]
MKGNKKTTMPTRKPSWLRRSLPRGPEYEKIRFLLREKCLHTVCEEALCPNIWSCFSSGTATFLIMGPNCTRSCKFCAVGHGKTESPDPEEPGRIAEAALSLDLQYLVITSVTRDDLPDGGASCFAETIAKIRESMPEALIEILIPDFRGNKSSLRVVLQAGPNVLNHNVETVPRLYPTARPEASYDRSLELLRRSGEIDALIPTKSGLMLGLGETDDEIERTLQDILDTGCSLLTLGQYLQPSTEHLPVKRFVPPDEFDKWRDYALAMEFSAVASGPFVRSSYRARELFKTI